MQSIVIQNVCKSYDKAVLVDVNLEVEQHQVVGLLGPNGSGKTTCFYIIVGLVRADSGKVFLRNSEYNDEQQIDISKLPLHRRAQLGIGYLAQEPSIFKKLTVEENILAVLQLRKDLNKTEQINKLELLLDELKITSIRHTVGNSVSGGERRRVEVARALAMEPNFILLDEPFAGVDPVSIHDIQNIIMHLKERNIGILITDHNVRETLYLCDKSYIIANGSIIAEGDTHTVLANEDVRSIYLGQQFQL